MTPQQHLSRARELDGLIQQQDRLLLRAHVTHVDARFLQRALRVRNALSREWGAAWQTKTISGGLHDATGTVTDPSSHNGESEPTL